jgi:hypothetical protein
MERMESMERRWRMHESLKMLKNRGKKSFALPKAPIKNPLKAMHFLQGI